MALVFRSSGSPLTNTQVDSNISQLDAGTVVQSGYTGNLDVNTLYAGRIQRNVTRHDLPNTGYGSPINITCNGMHLIYVPSNCFRTVYLNLEQNASNALIRVEGTSTASGNIAVFRSNSATTGNFYASGHTSFSQNLSATGTQSYIPIPVYGSTLTDGTAAWIYLYRYSRPYGTNVEYLVLGYEPGGTI